MTENQIKYLSLQETARHNAAMERQDANELVERNRSNLANEDIKRDEATFAGIKSTGSFIKDIVSLF